jgi:dTDP-4-dehydrorhamnose reductase
MLERALIFGNGYVGSRFAARIPGAVIARADITDRQAVRKALQDHRPASVLNCAGKTGRPNIDWCEDHAAETMASNTLGPLVLAMECLDAGVPFAHVGTGCIYTGDDGGGGYRETDAPNFTGNVYTRSKILSEQALRELPVLQLRLRLPIDSIPDPRNLVTKLAKYRKVIDVRNSISVLDDFVDASVALLEKRRTGIYNMTNPGSITLARILDLYKEVVDPGLTYEVVRPDQLPALRTGRAQCTLNTDKLAAEGVILPPIDAAIRSALVDYRSHLEANVKKP